MTFTAPATTMRAGRRPNNLGGLVWTLVRTDFVTRYHGTIGGFLWALLKPLTMFLVLMGVFSFVFTNTPQYRIGLILGLFLYEFFQEGTRAGLESLRAKGYLLTKARFPSWVLVVAATSNAVITLVLVSVVLITFLVLSGRAPSLLAVALYGWYLLHFFAVVTGFSLAASVLFMQYRDLNQVWEVVTQAGFFIAPIIYPISVLPERLHFYLYLWPPTPIILFARSVLVEGRVPSALAHGLLTLEAAVVLGVGAWIYSARAPRVPEYL
jgi:homopolymeric O-antigen transport system permease protein